MSKPTLAACGLRLIPSSLGNQLDFTLATNGVTRRIWRKPTRALCLRRHSRSTYVVVVWEATVVEPLTECPG